MNKKNMLTLAATSALAGGFLGGIFGGKRKTVSDIRCKEKKVAKRRAKNKNKKRS